MFVVIVSPQQCCSWAVNFFWTSNI